MTAVHLMNSHRWLHEELSRCAPEQEGWHWAAGRDDADVVVYLEPPWRDRQAPEPLSSLRPRDFRRVFVYSQDDAPASWAPGMYCSLPRSRAGPGQVGGFYVPHHHQALGELLATAADRKPDLLWSFVGTFENAGVRSALAAVQDPRGLVRDTRQWSDTVRWNWENEHREAAARMFRDYAETLARSKFVLCPRGRGPSSIRIFEALQIGRCPVILSDEWLPPPFVDWERCALVLPEAQTPKLPSILRAHEDRAESLGRRARAVWEEFFAPAARLPTIVRACVDLQTRHRATTGVRTSLAVKALLSESSLRRAGRAVRSSALRHAR